MMNWTTLRQNIEQYFSEEELRALCFDLGVDYENLGGRGKAGRVMELVTLFQRNGRAHDLLAQLTHLRPHVTWDVSEKMALAEVISGPAPVPETVAERRIRNDFLQKVKVNWIQGILEKSLHNILRLELGFTYKPEVLTRSWSMTLQQPEAPEQDLPENTSILEVFRQHQQELLILGEPGAGKTITLLELARDLILLAEADETQPIPVVLNLSSWAEKQLPFATWLEDSLLHEYQLPRKAGQKWITTDYQVSLLLDGVDEVQAEHREACVMAINDFRAEHLVDIVICSRAEDYEDLQTRLNISTAVMLRSLTLVQIEAYLEAGGESLAALRQVLQEDAHLQALAQTPLLLSMMTMTFRNQPVSTIQDDSRPVEQRRRLFDHYVQYMFAHQRLTAAQQEENRKRLSWLAQHLALRTQSVFSPDMLQKTWLPTKTAQRTFVLLVSLFYGFMIAITIGVLLTFIFGIPSWQLTLFSIFISIVSGYIGFQNAQNNPITNEGFWEQLSKINIPLRSYRDMIHILGISLGIGFSMGIVGLLDIGLIWAIIIGVIAGIIYWLIRSRKDVRFFLLQGINHRNFPRILAFSKLYIFMGVLIGFVGYGIGLLLWNPIQIMLLGLLLSLLLWLILQLFVILGVPLVIFATHVDSFIRHYLLRAVFALYHAIPWQPNYFLDEMVVCGLLRRSGKSYLFVHGLLRDHFAGSVPETGGFSAELSRFDLNTLWKTANIHREQREFELALLCFDRAIELEPKSAGIFRDRGIAYREMGDYTLALADFNHAIELKPKWSRLFEGRGRTYWEMEEYPLALADFNRAIELEPKSAWLFGSRGHTYREMENYTLALVDFNRAVELKPEWAGPFGDRGITYREMKEYSLALADFNRAIELEPKWAGLFQDRGRTYREMEEYALALADFNRAIELQPKSAGLFQDRGRTYREMEEYPLALADFNRAIELQPKWAGLFQERGRTYQQMEEYALALADFNRAFELEPKSAWLFGDRGRTYQQMQEYALALADFNRALELEPKWAGLFGDRGNTYREMKEYPLALADFNRAIELESKSAWLFGGRGRTYLEMEEYALALADFNRAIELQPKWAGLFGERGITYRKMEEYSLALADFNRALELEPKWAGPFKERGRTYREMEEYKLALADFNQAIELQPKSAWLFQDRGCTYREMEEYALALADFNRAIELEPKWAGLFQERGRTYREMEEYALAVADFNRAIELEPKWAGLFQDRGRTYREMEEYALAVADFNRAIELEPKWDWLFRERGTIYREMEEYTLALADFDRAIELDPKWAGFFRDRGITYREMKEYQLALADFNRAIELQPKSARLFEDRGRTYREMKEYQLALTDLNRAIELEPKWAGLFRDRGSTYREMEEYALALADFNRAIELQPKSAGLFQDRGRTYREMEEYALALADFNRAIELEPKWAGYFRDRGITYLLLSDTAKAAADFQTAIVLAKQDCDKYPDNWGNSLYLAFCYLNANQETEAQTIYQSAHEAPVYFIKRAIKQLEEFQAIFPDHSQAQAMRELLQRYLHDKD